MKVVNFDQKVFDSFLQKNLEKFLDENGNCLVVGIKEGGIPIAKMVVKQLQKESSAKIDFVSVTCQRPSTKRKKSNQLIKITLQKSFKILPQSILNRLRVIEYKYLLHKAENNSREIFRNKENKWILCDDNVLKEIMSSLGFSYSFIYFYFFIINILKIKIIFY